MKETFTCGGCGQKLKATPGVRVRCPACGWERKLAGGSRTRASSMPPPPSGPPTPPRTSSSGKSGQVSLQCPECSLRPVETAAKLQVIRGFLLFARLGSYTVIGCGPCVASAARAESLRNFLLGWWTFPWGFLAPFYAIQNLLNSSSRPNREKLASALVSAGVNIEDITLDASGMTGMERRFLEALARILGQVVLTKGKGTPEWRAAEETIAGFSEGKLGRAEASTWLDRFAKAEFDPSGRPFEERVGDHRDRVMLLRLVIEVAMADGAIDPSEKQAISLLATRLRLSPQEFNRVFNAAEQEHSVGRRQNDQERAQALRILGLGEDASHADIRNAYRQLMVKHHPDLAPPDEQEEATRRAAQINHAYDVLIGSQ